MLKSLASILLAGSVLPATIDALLVAPDSPCASRCGNILDSTTGDDVVCGYGDYTTGYNDNAAQVFQSCLECELHSGYSTQDNYTDAMAMLYNLRYTVSYCVLNYPKNDHYTDGPCGNHQTCGIFQNGLEYKNLSIAYDRFDYCDQWPTADNTDLKLCTQCLQADEDFYLANFMTVLHAGCQQKPQPGVTVAILGEIFSNDTAQITAPTPIATVDPNWFDHGPLSLGGTVGVAIGVILFLLVLVGAGIIWRGKKRRRSFLRQLEMQYANARNGSNVSNLSNGGGGGGGGAAGGWPSPQPSPQRDMGETPLSQRPLRSWDDSPMTVTTEQVFPRYFSPYSSQFNSPVSAQEGPPMPWPEPALGVPREIGISLADRFQQYPQPLEESDREKGKRRDESYELQHVGGAGGAGGAGGHAGSHL